MVKKFNKGKVVASGKIKRETYTMKLDEVRLRNTYIKELIKGRYFLARYNMVATQLLPGKKILETVDGAPKTKEYIEAECAMQKMQATSNMRQSHFAKKDLIEKYGYSKDMIKAIEIDYYDGKIIREDYDVIYKKGNRAQYVDAKTDKKS